MQQHLKKFTCYEVLFSTGCGKWFSQTPLDLRANKSHMVCQVQVSSFAILHCLRTRGLPGRQLLLLLSVIV